MNIKELFNGPKVIGVCSNPNCGKSNLLYHIITTLQKDTDFKLYTYGLRNDLGIKEQKIYSVQELELIRNSIIICDEFFTLFDLEDRKKRKAIENTLRLIHHNNNILVLSGLPENFKKFISAKLEVIFFKNSALADFINGSRIKDVILNYKGAELGSTILNIDINKTLLFDGEHYQIEDVPYLPRYDTKKDNEPILKKVHKNVPKKDK